VHITQPELLTGTLRENIDPFGEHDDMELHKALCAAGLYSLQRGEDAERLNLDSAVSSSGENLSFGQRQIIALARAIVRRSRLLILDEGTLQLLYLHPWCAERCAVYSDIGDGYFHSRALGN
jgi:ABC-type multidrug transport system fused ATPase/permease subunit